MADEQQNVSVEVQEQAQGTAQQEAQQQETYDPFGESVPEIELMGGSEETPSSDGNGKSEDLGDNTEKTPPKDERSEEQASEKKGDEKAKPEDSTAKPPKGYVPHAALQEERAKRKEAQRQLDELQKRLVESKPQEIPHEKITVPVDTPDDVKEFIQAHPKYTQLVLEQSPDGQRLREKIETFGMDEAADFARTLRVERELDAKQQQSVAEKNNQFSESCVREMDRLFDGGLNGKEASDLVAHLQDVGLAPDTITLLTSPNTVLVDPRTGKGVAMGTKALELVGFFKDSFKMQQSFDPEAMRASIRKEVEAEVTKNMMEKFKGGGNGFQDIGNVPGMEERPGNMPTSEDAFAKLSEAEQERLLMGM